MSDFTAVGLAIYARIGGTAGTVSVYQALAPQGGSAPYAIFQRQTAQDDYVFGPTEFTSADYVVKVVSRKQWPTEAQSIYTHLHNLMQQAPLSVTGYTVLRCHRTTTLEYLDPESFWHVGGIYRIELAKS